ncbi:MAG: diaminopimelate decarboxylase [Terriglobia bacterium]
MRVAKNPVAENRLAPPGDATSGMNGLQYRRGELFCEDVSLAELAMKFGTPLYVYSRAAILGRVTHLRQALQGIQSLLCYSVKANSNLSILSLLRAADCGYDIVSGGELARCIKMHADASRIVFSGVGKTRDEIDAALQAGILLFNVESTGELELLEARAQHHGALAPVSIRINPDVEAETHPYISTGQTGHKFGVPKEEALALYQHAAVSPALRIAGIACHIGSQILETAPYLRAMDELLAVARALKTTGVQLEYVDLGGGFGVRYTGEDLFDLDQLAAGLRARLRGSGHQLILEPGRFIVGEAGVLITTVLYVKRNPRKNFIVVDAGMNDLIRPSLYGSYHGVIPVKDAGAGRLVADVVGPVCETGDFLARDRDVPEVESGAYLAILSCGAYGSCLASNYNSRPRPAEVLVHGNAAQLIRRRETMDDLMRAEVF